MGIWVIILLLLACDFSCAAGNRIRINLNPLSLKMASQLSSKKPNNPKYEEKFFTQILDHFNYNPESYTTFQQKYLINDAFWGGPKQNFPIFVYAGNEGNIETFAQNTGFMFNIAPTFKPLLVFIEHRYYGESIPFGGNEDIAFANSSTMGYLSTTQALADFATLILDLKKNLTAENSPVVVFGGSYGGLLAAWLRMKYPHVTIGAVASSAPLLAFDNITSPYAYNDIITWDFRNESENCYQVIKTSWDEISKTAARAGGLDILRKSFKICQNITDLRLLTNFLRKAFFYAAMTDYPTPANLLQPLPAYPVKQMCRAIDEAKTGRNIFEKIYAAVNIYYNYTGDVSCFSLISDEVSADTYAWIWQSCTELIIPQSGSTRDSMFPPHTYDYVTDFLKPSESIFGVEPRPKWIVTEFGGPHIYRDLKLFGSNIILYNGLRDPWSAAGVLKNISDTIVAIVAKDGAHHLDLRPSTPMDPKWLQDIRKQEVRIISEWLSQYYKDLVYPK